MDPPDGHTRPAPAPFPLRGRHRPHHGLRTLRDPEDADDPPGRGPGSPSRAPGRNSRLPPTTSGQGPFRPRDVGDRHRAGDRTGADLGIGGTRVRRDPGAGGDDVGGPAPARDVRLAGRSDGPPRDPLPLTEPRRGPGRPLLPPRLHLGHRPGRHRRLPVLARPRLLERPDRDVVRPHPAGETRRGRAAARGGGLVPAVDESVGGGRSTGPGTGVGADGRGRSPAFHGRRAAFRGRRAVFHGRRRDRAGGRRRRLPGRPPPRPAPLGAGRSRRRSRGVGRHHPPDQHPPGPRGGRRPADGDLG